jgi:FMN-dependent oxidoreductase (nitrilotriacetate monooxygenase family)
MPNRQLKLGAILSGVGTSQNGWRHPDLPGDASVDIDWYRENARKAEAAKFDFVFMVDSPYITPDTAPHFLNRLEPLTLLSALAASTTRIGLIATLTTSFTEPFNVARQFGSLDLISRGRAGWNVVTTGLEGAAKNYGREEHIDHTVRYRRAREHLAVVQGLWDSYEDDAFPRDKTTGVFLDKTRQHALDHRGEFFSVAGPLNISRSRQGQPVIFQAGSSDEGRDFAASAAEGIYANAETFDEAREYYRDIKRRTAAAGRNPDHILIFPGIVPVIADTDDEALRRDEAESGKLDMKKALVQLGRPFNYHDFSRYPLDEPFPDLGDLGSNGYRGAAERVKRVARDERLTLRETAWRFAARRRHEPDRFCHLRGPCPAAPSRTRPGSRGVRARNAARPPRAAGAGESIHRGAPERVERGPRVALGGLGRGRRGVTRRERCEDVDSRSNWLDRRR